MAVPTTWTELKAELAVWMIRDDLTSIIPNAIGYAEAGFQKTVFSPEREEQATIAFTSEVANLPADFWGVRTAYWNGTSKVRLQQVTVSKLREDYPTTATGTPVAFAIEGETMLLGPPPSSGDVELTYWETIPVLSGSNATNWLLTDHPELYVAASLAYLFRYTRHFDEAANWANATAAMIEQVNRSGRRRMTNSGPIAASPSKSDQILSVIR